METTGQIYEKFVDEYTSEDAVRKYTTGTAGFGITYLLSNDYAEIYLNASRFLLAGLVSAAAFVCWSSVVAEE